MLVLIASCFVLASTIEASMEDNRVHPVPPDSLPGSHGIYYNSRYLQHDTLLSDLLTVRKMERYFFTIKEDAASSVSATVMPCTSKLYWTIRYRAFEKDEGTTSKETILEAYTNQNTTTYHQENPPKGIYIIQVTALDEDSYVKFFVSTSSLVDPEYWETFDSNITLIRGKDNERQKYHELTFKWRSSLIRPYDMHYCLVINQNRTYNTLCEAQGKQFGVPYTLNSSQVAMHKRYRDDARGEVIMGCVGRRTKYKISLRDFNNKKKYNFDLFILDKSTSLSYLYGRESFYPKERNKKLKDGKRKTIEFRRGKLCTSYKYKVKKHNSTMYVNTDVCTGSVSTTVIREKGFMKRSETTQDHGQITIQNAKKGTYKIKVCGESDDKIQTAKLMVTVRKKRMSFPVLPNNRSVTVASNTLNCNSATIKWMPSPDPKSQRYCILIWLADQQPPNYCKTNNPPCEKKMITTNPWISENIGNLEPGLKYNVQVQVYQNRKKKSLPRNYQTTTFETQPYCLFSRNYVNSKSIRHG